MELISEQEFGEQIDEFIRESKFKDKEAFNRAIGREDLLEDIQNNERFKNLSMDIEYIAALVDLGTALPLMNINDDRIFTPEPIRDFTNSYTTASGVHRLLKIDSWEGLGIAGDVEDLEKDLKYFASQNYFDKKFGLNELLEAIYGVLFISEPVKASTPKMENLKESFDNFRKYELSNADDRKMIYDYWASTNDIFNQFEGVVIDIPLLGKLKILQRDDLSPQMLENNKRLISQQFDIPISQIEIVRKNYERILNKIKDLKIPKYTVTFNEAPSMEQYENKVTLIKLASDFIKKLSGEDTEEYSQYFSRNEVDNAYQAETEYSESQVAGTNTNTASIDMTEEDGESVLQEIEKVYKKADPLSLLQALKTSGFYINQETAEALEEKLQNELSQYLTDSNIREKVKQSYLTKIQTFVEEVKSDLVDEAPYVFSILDDNVNENFLNKLKTSEGKQFKFNLQYYTPTVESTVDGGNIKFTLVEEEVSSYSNYVNKVNKMATDLFDTIVEVKGIIPEAKFNVNRARGESQRGSAHTTSMRGGNYLPIAGKFAESLPASESERLPTTENEVTYAFYEQLVLMFNEYYYDTMDVRYLFYSDRPKFTEGQTKSSKSSYKNIASLSNKSNKSVKAGIRRAMVKTPKILIDNDDLISLKKFFEKLKYWSRLTGNEVVEMLSSIQPIFRKLYTMDLIPDEGQSKRQAVTGISSNLTNYMGNLGYKILSSANKNLQVMYPPDNSGKPISEYETSVSDITRLKIFDILEDETFIEYAKDNKMFAGLRDLKMVLRNNPLNIKQELGDNKEAMYKAYVQAVDTLREGRGDTIYKAFLKTDNVEDVEYVLDLIQKEDRIDLYARDIEGITESRESYNSISYLYGISPDIIYKIKGLFR